MKIPVRIGIGILLALLLLGTIAMAEVTLLENGSPATTREIRDNQVTGADETEILNAHNTYRSAVRSPPLVWCSTLSTSAQTWADTIAASGTPAHSGNPSYGENIAWGNSGALPWTTVVDNWASEKQYFVYGPFGNGSSTMGHWWDVGHYTQIVWYNTLRCGCGKATGSGTDFFVCQYSPPGNYLGQYPYPQITTNPGVFRPSIHKFYLDTSGDGVWNAGDTLYTFGAAGDIPITGDWNSDATTEIGVFRNATHKFYLDKSGDGVWNAGDSLYTFGNSGDIPITGDWNSDATTEIGVFRNATHKFYLDKSGDGVWGAGDTLYTFGAAGDIPITGDWNSDGITEIGVFRNATHKFYLDKTGNGVWNTGDTLYTFGAAGDKPVTGKWS